MVRRAGESSGVEQTVAAKDRLAVLNAMMQQAIIPVFYDPDTQVCLDVIQACSNAGAKCVEFTNRGEFAAHTFLEVARHFAAADPSVIMGVGSVVDSALLNADVARLCNRRGIPYCPGCGSATEIGDAQELGCEIVKVFPGSSVGGADFVRSVMAPMPWTRIMPTGGVDPGEKSLREWFSAGIVACGIGSNLITRDLLKARDYAGIERKVREAVELAARIRQELGH